MMLDINGMYNYQIICNDTSIVGTIHSYVPTMISLRFFKAGIILERKKKVGMIVKAILVEE